jgi:glycosyltransferase involved in cell wall biosynthesis
MKIALIQDDIYLPSFGGGLKANRYLLEGFARQGHDCLVLSRALTRSADGPRTVQEFAAEMQARNIVFQEVEPNVFSYESKGVQIDAMNFSDPDTQRDYLVRRLREINPDWIFVTDDKRRIMLQAALDTAPSRVILMLQTIISLPFGPLSVDKNPAYAELIRSARAIIVISHFMKNYIHQHGGLNAHLLSLPVYGEGPFPDLSDFDHGYVTMINPCELKGVSIFIALASAFPDVEFAAVPTWGANQDLLDRLQLMPNVRLLKANNDINVILEQTRILLVPSLWPETFGYVAPEAMLRGIPVLASDIGGLPEAKLGIDYVLPVIPGEFGVNGFVSPPQDITPWTQALDELLSNENLYVQCSRQSRQAAHDFVATVSVAPFEALLEQLTEVC